MVRSQTGYRDCAPQAFPHPATTFCRGIFRLVCLMLFVGACRGAGNTQDATLTIFAAASLGGAFAEAASAFEQEHPGVAVQLNLAGSQQLAQQLAQGAPADLFASANSEQMAVAIAAGRVAAGAPTLFAANELIVVVPVDNPAALGGVEDLGRPGLRLLLADEAVPAGDYARQMLAKAGPPLFQEQVLANVVSFEQNVRAVVTKVSLGEADAGIVYRTDAPAGSEVTSIPIPPSLNVRAGYSLAPVLDAARPELAADFIAFILSPPGQAILARHGFLPAALAP